jgi:hypothetical protein
MKVCIECTASELEQLVETLSYGKSYRDKLRTRTEVSARDDVPNRFREEGT